MTDPQRVSKQARETEKREEQGQELRTLESQNGLSSLDSKCTFLHALLKNRNPQPGLSTDMQESPGSTGVDGGYANNVPAFLTKLWMLVEDPETNHLICWSTTGTSFHVFDQGRFAKEVLPKYFKHNNMASFIRQLNMYGFRKVVNIEQSGLLKPERDDTEFQHLFFLQGHEHLLEHIKRKVSIVKSEETKFRQEDLSKLLYEVQVLRNQQENMECQIQDMKQQNEVLWSEVVSLRENHTQQQKVMNKPDADKPPQHSRYKEKIVSTPYFRLEPTHTRIKQLCLDHHIILTKGQENCDNMGLINTALQTQLNLVRPLMLDDGSTTPPTAKLSHSHNMELIQGTLYIQSPSTEAVSCSTSNSMTVEPIVSEVTDMSRPCPMAIQMEEARKRCPIVIKKEPVSPAVQRWNEDVSSEPPVLPLALVQSVLGGQGSGSVESRAKRTMNRPETPEDVENVDMNFEELQLLLRNPQHSMESSSASGNTFSMPMNEWNYTEVDTTLRSELANMLIPAAMSQYMFHCQESDVCNTEEQ
ncbi:Heat shock factor protein 4 [Bagarius yarrelli]|uniref:Heat shock factor protein 4 n=1 Tax=Bagarius yarrelli TaxID=175774 RepID=A0A556V2U2_BAGYA|nr:Heat shock factor protein 4 [Bagarius yarrelli]